MAESAVPDASRKVREMFTEIAPRYDLLNHLLSLQLDRLWRARTARRLQSILDRPDALVLDLCCGTGDLAFALARAGKARIVGADFVHPMLVRARKKTAAQPQPANQTSASPMPFFEADALRLPFAGASFEPGGTIAILEFTEPPDGRLGDLYRWYFCKVLPKIGGLISGDRSAYTYLPNSVARFLRPPELAALMTAVGYHAVDYRVWTLGTVALHRGLRAK